MKQLINKMMERIDKDAAAATYKTLRDFALYAVLGTVAIIVFVWVLVNHPVFLVIPAVAAAIVVIYRIKLDEIEIERRYEDQQRRLDELKKRFK